MLVVQALIRVHDHSRPARIGIVFADRLGNKFIELVVDL